MLTADNASRQGRHGEALFSERCQSPAAGIDAVVNKASDDENGWDHVIDLRPPSNQQLPSDLANHLFQCFAQIKTTSAEQPKTRLKLSNAVKAAKSPSPTFIFLFHHQRMKEGPVLYGRHIWREEIEAILKRARMHSQKGGGAPLHKSTWSLSFSQADAIEVCPSDWLYEVIQKHGAGKYSARKIELIDTVGYGEFTHRGVFSIPNTASAEEVVLHELGLSEDIPVANFQLFDQRFGIEVPVQNRFGDDGRMKITSEPMPAVLKILDENGRFFDISAICRVPKLIHPTDPNFRIRIDAGGIDILTSPNQSVNDIRFSLDLDGYGPFDQKIGLVSMLAYASKKPLRFEVHLEHGKLFGGEVSDPPLPGDWIYQHAKVGAHICDLLGPQKSSEVQTSFSEFQKNVADMHLATAIMQSGSLRFDGEFKSDVDEFELLIGYSCTKIGSWSVGAIYQIDHKARKRDRLRQTFYFGNPKIVKSFAFKQPISSLEKTLTQELESIRLEATAPSAIIMDGNLTTWWRAMENGEGISIDIE